MALDKRTRTTYQVRCDRCGNVAPGTPVQEEALLMAEQEGWQHLSKWNGLEYVHTDLCPSCYEEWEAEQGEGWEKAKAEQFGQEPG